MEREAVFGVPHTVSWRIPLNHSRQVSVGKALVKSDDQAEKRWSSSAKDHWSQPCGLAWMGTYEPHALNATPRSEVRGMGKEGAHTGGEEEEALVLVAMPTSKDGPDVACARARVRQSLCSHRGLTHLPAYCEYVLHVLHMKSAWRDKSWLETTMACAERGEFAVMHESC